MKLRFKNRATRLIFCALACLLALLLVAISIWPRPQDSGLAISFVAFTNALGGSRSAVFGVTNICRRTITFVTPEPQIRTNGVWAEIVVAGPFPLDGLWLYGGQGTNVTVAVPNRGEAWRMPILYAYHQNKGESYVYQVKLMLQSLSGGKYHAGSTGYRAFSAVMELTKA